MKKSDWLLVVFSAILYTLPFLWSDILWWLIFIFPVPLLYLTRTQNLSFIHGYVWGCIVFVLHLSGGIYIVAQLAHESWLIGVLLGVVMILYQALFPAIIFLCTTVIIRFFAVQSPMLRLCMWFVTLVFFIFWTDRYCLWVFGIKEGYPLMHPLLPLVQEPSLLILLPIIGKSMLTILFLLVPVSGVLLLWYQNYIAALFFVCAIIPWLLSYCLSTIQTKQPDWWYRVKSLPCMAYATVDNPVVTIKIVAYQLKKIIEKYPHTTVIVMPESAFNITDFENRPALLELWNEYYLGKAVHLIFGTCRWKEGCYYNSLYWVHNGVLQECFDKKHAMLITERLSEWMNNGLIQQIYFKDGISITRSQNDRIKLPIEGIIFVPYICSELFFNELPDDNYGHVSIVAIVNDMLFLDSYIQQLLLLLARLRAIQWQRNIVYVSYGRSLCINTHGLLQNVNE